MRKQYNLGITEPFNNFCREYPLKTPTAAAVAQSFLENCVYPYRIPLYPLTNNRSSFVSKFFKAACSIIGVKHVTTTAYHLQTNGHAKRFNKILVDWLRQYVAKRQTRWHEIVQPLTNAYNIQAHRTTGIISIDSVLTRHPPAVQVEMSSKSLPNNGPEGVFTAQVKWYTLARLREALASAWMRTNEA